MCEKYIDWLPLAHAQLETRPTTQVCAMTQDLTVRNWTSDFFSSQASTQPTEPHQPGQDFIFNRTSYQTEVFLMHMWKNSDLTQFGKSELVTFFFSFLPAFRGSLTLHPCAMGIIFRFFFLFGYWPFWIGKGQSWPLLSSFRNFCHLILWSVSRRVSKGMVSSESVGVTAPDDTRAFQS